MPNKGKQTHNDTKTTGGQSSHIPYILNGELYEIQTRDGENVTVKCCNCPPDRVYRGSVRSTGNFHMHIKRRHSSLLGKLHDMKVAALLERRDRLRNIRRSSQRNKNVHVEEKRELKIKTVFKRHKQEQQQQGQTVSNSTENMQKPSAAAAITSVLNDTETQPEVVENNVDLNNAQDANNLPLKSSAVDHAPQLETQHAVLAPTFINGIATQLNFNTAPSNMANTTPIFNAFGQFVNTNGMQHGNFLRAFAVPFGLIKPEHLQIPQSTQAIDLTVNNNVQNNSVHSNPDVEFTPSVAFSETENRCIVGNFRDIFVHIDTSLRDIQHELHTRNQIESRRVLLDLAKFKFQHPEFQF